jgi:nucleotide-binding universal stress UspA family protein
MAINPYPALADVPVDQARKFLVVVDDSPECRLALRFAAGRAAHTLGGRVMLLYVLRPVEFFQWGGVQHMMEAEAHAEAEALLETLCQEVEQEAQVGVDAIIRAGKSADIVLSLLKEDPQICSLVLGASPTGAPGPLVDFFSGDIAGTLPCPLTIVPGSLDPNRVDALA